MITMAVAVAVAMLLVTAAATGVVVFVVATNRVGVRMAVLSVRLVAPVR